ncbi:hypothetical protein BN946_scf184936.g4 [Trametes cinnabarina]|uniref:Uncharacterized protein n=1 Tax=Pycnoporus cinnabarinus TaxID=5643 RepID=A0A060SZ81_PYCCI|nr:hypothetical protein BN946_scf184936.g4 [Trametes cinnabarina]
MSSAASNITIGQNHQPHVLIGAAENSSPATADQGHALHVAIPENDARTPAPLDTPSHGHPNIIDSAAMDAHVSTSDGTSTGQLQFALPAGSSPVNPRPSARVWRRRSLFSVANDAHSEHEAQDGGSLEHPLFDLAQNGLMAPTGEVEAPESAELDGHFDQPRGADATSSTSSIDNTTPVGDA